jgi:hypothetical protein
VTGMALNPFATALTAVGTKAAAAYVDSDAEIVVDPASVCTVVSANTGPFPRSGAETVVASHPALGVCVGVS